MTEYTNLLEFHLPLHNPVLQKTALQEISSHLGKLGFKEAHTWKEDQHFAFLVDYVHPEGSRATVRGYKEGLMTVDIHQYSSKSQPPITFQETEDLTSRVKASLQCTHTKCLPAIKRGSHVDCYFPTADNKLIEYDFDKKVFEADSPYQNVKIMHSTQFGNMLLLDNDPNLAESDLMYTQTITGSGKEDYRDKTVLILGGGDGGILHELKKHSPKFITMIDIDSIVVEESRKHLRGICYDSLDQLKGDNYEVLLEDCVPFLKKYGEEGRVFDFVINDLTAIPVTTSPIGDQWDFLQLILDLSMKVLAPDGKYYTQGNSVNMVRALAMYEKRLSQLAVEVEFSKKTVCVPSYHELWVFYEIWKKDAGGKKQISEDGDKVHT